MVLTFHLLNAFCLRDLAALGTFSPSEPAYRSCPSFLGFVAASSASSLASVRGPGSGRRSLARLSRQLGGRSRGTGCAAWPCLERPCSGLWCRRSACREIWTWIAFGAAACSRRRLCRYAGWPPRLAWSAGCRFRPWAGGLLGCSALVRAAGCSAFGGGGLGRLSVRAGTHRGQALPRAAG